MENKITSVQQLIAVINYILWSYDVNNDSINDKQPKVIVQDLNNVWLVRIEYIGEIRKGNGHEDPQTATDDQFIMINSEFNLLKKESFRQLTKYINDVCEEISKIKM